VIPSSINDGIFYRYYVLFVLYQLGQVVVYWYSLANKPRVRVGVGAPYKEDSNNSKDRENSNTASVSVCLDDTQQPDESTPLRGPVATAASSANWNSAEITNKK
jgi:hypothetical protein